MGLLVDKDGFWIITSFLGKKPTQSVMDWNKIKNEEERAKVKHGLQSVNGFVGNHTQYIPLPELSVMNSSILGIEIDCPFVQIDNKNWYYPVALQWEFKPFTIEERGKVGLNRYFINNFIYINKLGRPNLSLINNKLKKILSSEYEGKYHIESGRYVFCFDHLDLPYVEHLLSISKHGDGKNIDYTWIAPFQDLYEEKFEVFQKSQKKRKTRKTSGQKPVEREDEYIPGVENRPPRWGENPVITLERMKGQLAQKKARLSADELAIKRSSRKKTPISFNSSGGLNISSGLLHSITFGTSGAPKYVARLDPQSATSAYEEWRIAEKEAIMGMYSHATKSAPEPEPPTEPIEPGVGWLEEEPNNNTETSNPEDTKLDF